MLNPPYPAAVVAGNVETVARHDRRVVRRARQAWRARQGTMNNFTFGNDTLSILRDDLRRLRRRRRHRRHRRGAHAHDQHAADRSGSARNGATRSAWQVCHSPRLGRRAVGVAAATASCASWSFCAPLEVCDSRAAAAAYPPYGLAGGACGRAGPQHPGAHRWCQRRTFRPGPIHSPAGDVLVIETPGGGGFGRAGESREAAE